MYTLSIFIRYTIQIYLKFRICFQIVGQKRDKNLNDFPPKFSIVFHHIINLNLNCYIALIL